MSQQVEAGTSHVTGVDATRPVLRGALPSGGRRRLRIVGLAFALALALATGALAGAAFRTTTGAPARSSAPPPAVGLASPSSTVTPTSAATPSPAPTPSPLASASPSPTPVAGPVDIDLASGPAVFSSQLTKELCAPAGLTSALATMGLVKASDAVQREVESHIKQWWSVDDSRNFGWGPLAMTKALAYYGAPGYVVKAFTTRDQALRAAGIALSATHEPVLLLAWWGAHTWVMTGYRATSDLATNPKASFTGAYIVDPWYPRVSSIWGHVQPPGHFYDMAGLIHNYIAWTRPEGRYPTRDGKWVAVLPTQTRPGTNG